MGALLLSVLILVQVSKMAYLTICKWTWSSSLPFVLQMLFINH